METPVLMKVGNSAVLRVCRKTRQKCSEMERFFGFFVRSNSCAALAVFRVILAINV
jgi:hypothetical protein